VLSLNIAVRGRHACCSAVRWNTLHSPQQKILIQADAFNPPPAPVTQTPAVVNPYHQSLLANIEQRGLDVQRINPVHLPGDNRTVTLAELKTAVGKQ